MAREIVGRARGRGESRSWSASGCALLPRDPNDDRDVIVEIRAGTGGEEAALFAAELFRMYARYAERHRWGAEVLTTSETGIGGLREVIFEVSGDGAWSRLKYEGGVHRVQRVPETESSGRIHTSTATVAVLPEADEVEVQIDEAGTCASTSSARPARAARASTRPTPRCASRTCRRASWSRSRTRRASTRTRPRRWPCCARGCWRWSSARRTRRRPPCAAAMVGSGDRSEKIRTYNFPQDRRHRPPHRHGPAQPARRLDGDLDRLIDALITTDQARLLANLDGGRARRRDPAVR